MTSKTKIEFTLPLFVGLVHLAPSLNTQRDEHWTAKQKRKDMLKSYFETLHLPKIYAKYRVSYVRSAIRLLDPIDNLPASMKNIMDVLQEMNLIPEDNHSNIVLPILSNQLRVHKKKLEQIYVVLEEC